jgi:spermidine synthase
MALQIALLFSFQCVYGFVYELVGLILALFMAGLALGAAVTHRFIEDKASLRALAAVQLLIALLAGLVAVALPRFAAVRDPRVVFVLFSAVTFVAGILNGADFPLATACCMAVDGRAEKATGVVYGVELFGACSGAVLAGVAVVPVLGIVACCLLAATANAAAFLIFLVCGATYAWAQ